MRRRRLLILSVVLALLASGATAWAAQGQGGIELVGGSGRATLTLRGAALGTVDQGRITIRLTGGRTDVSIGGDLTRTIQLPDGTTYIGRNLRFRVFKGSWRLVLDGTGINASAVGKGFVNLRGSGQYSLDGGARTPWPSQLKTIRLGGRDKTTSRGER